MTKPQILTITELVEKIPAKLGFIPRDSLVTICLSADSAVRMIVRVDLADIEDPTTRADVISAIVRHFEDTHTEAVILAIYSDEGADRYAADIDKAGAALTEHVTTVIVNYVTQGTVTDADGTNARAIDRDPVTAARPTEAPEPDALDIAARAADKIRAMLTDEPNMARVTATYALTELLDAVQAGTYPHVVNPETLGIIAGAIATVQVRDAVVVAMVEDTDDYATARALAVDPHAPGVKEALQAIISTDITESVEPDTDTIRAKALLMWDISAHADSPEAVAACLSILAMLAFWHDDAAAAATYAREAISRARDYPTHTRLAELIGMGVEAGQRPGWTTGTL